MFSKGNSRAALSVPCSVEDGVMLGWMTPVGIEREISSEHPVVTRNAHAAARADSASVRRRLPRIVAGS